MRLIAYGSEGIHEIPSAQISDVAAAYGQWPVVWLNVDGMGDPELLRQIAAIFRLHPLAMEDVCNLYQRPKLEPYSDYFYLVARMADPSDALNTEQLSLFFGARFVITFQEEVGDCFEPIRERIRGDKGRIRRAASDYLTYALLDAVIDDFFPLLERSVTSAEAVEEHIIVKGDRKGVNDLHSIGQELLSVRRAIWPLRDAITTMGRESSPLIHAETRLYLRDCHDHTVQLIDTVESYRDLLSSLMEVHISLSNYRLNDIMRTLAIISVLFMPLNFIAGVYGMNFSPEASRWNMPELNWTYGYPFALSLMAVFSMALLVWFGRKGWMRG